MEAIMPTTIAAPKTKTAPATEKDFLPLQGTDYIEFYIGNAKQAAHFYKTAFGFQSLAYCGPETGTRDNHAGVSKMGVELQSTSDRLAVCRSLRGQCRLGSNESVGEVLRGCHGVPKHPQFR